MRWLLRLQVLEFGQTQTRAVAAEVAELRSKIPPQILGHYDRLRVRGKKGIVPVVNQVCTGCHMRLPLAVVMTLKRGDDIQLCDTCGRYLYLPEDAGEVEPNQTATEPAKTKRRGRKPRA
ncbi:MAG: C4-type zinc ribbon domain-containing protein, partial [Verrucomicrobiales bacterium]|nr:C4-type zinc ribbon domain-containing protein [Verrucomicrobiales bacterium]